MSKIKNGKEAISSKYQVLHETEYSKKDKLALSEKQLEYLENNGLTARFLWRKEYTKNSNFHASGWQVIPDSDMPGANAEGLVVVGDLVLGVRTKAASAAHRNSVNEKTARQSTGNVIKTEKAKLQQAMVNAGIKGKIIEGYEESADADDE
jgi:hypothetical protein